MKALYIASTGMAAQERNVEVISNNIANMRTTGFKRQRAEFQDLLYQSYRRAGASTSEAGTQVPVGIEIGSGVRVSATARIMSQGNVAPTEKELDLAIRGEGYFIVNMPDGRTAYTRDGTFERDATGMIVTVDGYELEPGIIIPTDATDVSISRDGIVAPGVSRKRQRQRRDRDGRPDLGPARLRNECARDLWRRPDAPGHRPASLTSLTRGFKQ